MVSLVNAIKMLNSSCSGLFVVLMMFLLEIINGDDFGIVKYFYQGLNSKADDCSSFTTQNGNYEKMSPSSKYLIFSGMSDFDVGWAGDESKDICEMIEQLEQAEVTNAFDLQSLERYIDVDIWIGLNHRNTTGVFLQASGVPIKFQSFVGMEPNNMDMSERCVMLMPSGIGFLTMADASCDSVKAGVLCQYRRGSSCFLQSAEETASSSAKKDNEVVNLAVGSRFFVSTIQRTWSTAFEICLAHGLQLITLDDDDINQDLADQVKKRLAEQHLHPATQFWTAGMLQRKSNSSEGRLAWFSGEDLIIPAVNLVPHQWARAAANVFEPFDQSKSGAENCLDISFENTDLESTGSYTPLWRTSNCLLPKFFICERVSHGVSEHIIARIIHENGNEADETNSENAEEETNSCGNVHADPLHFEIDVTRPQTSEDIIKFLIFNVEHDLKSGVVPYEIKDEIKWKGAIIDLLVKIAQKSVDTLYIDHGLLNVVKVIILIYLNAVPANATKNEPLWTNIYERHLKECLNSTTKIPLLGTGLDIKYLITSTGDSIDINVPDEHADNIKNLDSAINILWYLFSLSVGICYNLPQDKLGFASDFYVIFVADFIHDLRKIWTINVETAESSESRGLDYSLALGDFDVNQNFRNLRYLVTAAYIQSGVEKLQLVRPLDMSTINSDLPMAPENAKTGNTLRRR